MAIGAAVVVCGQVVIMQKISGASGPVKQGTEREDRYSSHP
jgi:hypothetical protein